MRELVIDLDDRVYAEIEEKAGEAGLTPEELIAGVVNRFLVTADMGGDDGN